MIKNKLVLLLLTSWLLLSCNSGEVIDYTQLQDRDGIFYKVNSDKPFSGRVLAYTPPEAGSILMFDCQFKDGYQHGKRISYFDNGQKKEVLGLKNGVNHGVRKIWFKNGQLKVEGTYSNGIVSGNTKRFYSNGQLWVDWVLEDTRVIQINEHYLPNGQKVAEELLNNGNGFYYRYDEKGSLESVQECTDGSCINSLFGTYIIGENTTLTIEQSKYTKKDIHLIFKEPDNDFTIKYSGKDLSKIVFFLPSAPYTQRVIQLAPDWQKKIGLGETCIQIMKNSSGNSINGNLDYDGIWCRKNILN